MKAEVKYLLIGSGSGLLLLFIAFVLLWDPELNPAPVIHLVGDTIGILLVVAAILALFFRGLAGGPLSQSAAFALTALAASLLLRPAWYLAIATSFLGATMVVADAWREGNTSASNSATAPEDDTAEEG